MPTNPNTPSYLKLIPPPPPPQLAPTKKKKTAKPNAKEIFGMEQYRMRWHYKC